MDWTLVSWYQGTDNDTDPSVAIIQVMYLSRAICFETYAILDISVTQDSDDWNAQLDVVAQNVLECCPSTQPNPNYDPSLTACWI